MKKIITTATIFLITLMASTQSNSQTKKSNRLEKEKIIKTVSSIFSGADERNSSPSLVFQKVCIYNY